MRPGCDFVELRRDAHAFAALAYAAFDDVADAEFLGDLLHVDGLALECERRVTCDHEEPAQLRQGRDDVLADPVRKIFLLGVAAEIHERQHRDGGPVGQGQGRARRFLSVFVRAGQQVGWVCAQWRHAHVAHEAQAFARYRSDQFLVAAAIAHSLACGIDAARQRRIGNDSATPNRCNQVVLADHPVTVLDQINQQVEYLRLDGNGLGATAQLAPVGVKCMIAKEKLHWRPTSASQGLGK